MTIKVINAGNCMLCGQKIKIVVRRKNSKFPNIFFCPECERRIKKGKPDTEESEEEE